MNINQLLKIIKTSNIPSFREKQVRQAYFKDLLSGWEEVTVLPKGLRTQLGNELAWSSLELADRLEDKRGDSIKAVFRTADNKMIESVLIAHKDGRRTACVSSQAGCPVGCVFCATGQNGFNRNLTSDEIVDQAVHFARELKAEGGRVTNVVFMGMGEPFLNYDNVIEAIRLMNSSDGLDIGARHISISTIGILPGIKRFADEDLQANLAFSLHAPNDKLRESLIPIGKKYDIKRVLKNLDLYIEKTNRRVMIEYLMIDGVNDRKIDAEELAELFRGRKLYFLNLIPYNQTGGFKGSSRENIDRFMEVLESKRIPCTLRREFGSGIWAACGQLAGGSSVNRIEE